jgi:hypothetical protein
MNFERNHVIYGVVFLVEAILSLAVLPRLGAQRFDGICS